MANDKDYLRYLESDFQDDPGIQAYAKSLETLNQQSAHLPVEATDWHTELLNRIKQCSIARGQLLKASLWVGGVSMAGVITAGGIHMHHLDKKVVHEDKARAVDIVLRDPQTLHRMGICATYLNEEATLQPQRSQAYVAAAEDEHHLHTVCAGNTLAILPTTTPVSLPQEGQGVERFTLKLGDILPDLY